jgi:hypothetical protein
MKIEKSSTENYEDKPGSTPTVKENAEEEDNDVFVLLVGQIIGQQKCRQKEQKKNDTAKNHLFLFKGCESRNLSDSFQKIPRKRITLTNSQTLIERG